MSKATAGPWFVYRDSAENCYVGSDIVDVARIVGSDADAHLMAAAPELLEATETLLFELVTGGTPVRDEVIAAARAAIAKATGEQP